MCPSCPVPAPSTSHTGARSSNASGIARRRCRLAGVSTRAVGPQPTS